MKRILRILFILLFYIKGIVLNAQTPTLMLVKDVFDNDVSHSYPNGISSFGNKVIFMGDDGIHGREPWVSDGTAAGTFMLKDIFPGENSSLSTTSQTDDYQNNYFFPVGGKMLFSARDNMYGTEPWITDGTTEGTMLLKDINQGDANGGSYPSHRSLYNGRMYFRALVGVGSDFEMWVTDGTEQGTQSFYDIEPAGFNYSAVHSDGKLYFNADSAGNGRELWVTDGTVSGTHMVKDAYPGFYAHDPYYVTSVGDKIIYSGDSAGYDEQPWVSDGTEEGTHLIKEINNGGAAYCRNYFAYEGLAYFSGRQDDSTGRELWVTDGTEAGTALLKELQEGSDEGNPRDFIAYNSKLWFGAQGNNVDNLWVTDGTEEGTVIFHEDANGPLLIHNNLLYFISEDHLMVTDGTEAGTYQVANPPGDAPPSLISMVANDDKVFVVARFSNAIGFELYSIEDIQALNKTEEKLFTLYPNPASENIYLSDLIVSDKNENLMITDITGRIIISELIPAGKSSASIDIKGIENGMYIVSIGNSWRKFIKN